MQDYTFMTVDVADEGIVVRVMANPPEKAKQPRRGRLVKLENAFVKAMSSTAYSFGSGLLGRSLR
jgi:hypothetical protein